jgi:hypothetical protein
MKQFKYLAIVLATCLIFNHSFAQNRIDLISGSPDEIILNIEIGDWDLNKVDAPRGTSYLLTSYGAKAILEKGAPDLPKLVRSIIIPDFALMAVEVTPVKFIDFENVEIAPSKGHFLRNQNPDSIPYIYGEWYSSDAFFPGKLAALNQPYILRDFRGQALDIFPFQYNAVTKLLRIYTELTVKIYSTGKTGENILHKNRKADHITREFQEIYSKHFINYNENLRYTPLDEEGSMLIICYDDFMSAMEPFVEWKNTIGLSTEIVALTSIGSTPATIKSYISNYYNTSNLVYVLFVGDAEQIPPYTAGLIEGYSDNAYGYLAGSDRYQEVFMGRFSAQNIAQVQTQVQRSIEYEQAHNFSNGWLHHGLGIARNEGAGGGHNGEADYVHMDLIRDKLLTYNYDVVYREYDGNVPGLTNTTAALISQRINDGVSVINFCNHGSVTGWSVANYNYTHVNALSNAGKLPFIWAVACVNGQFQGKTCFAEYWLRATDNTGNPTGAVATFMSTINQPWTPPMDAQDEFNDIMIESYSGNIKRTYGGISINGVYKMLDLNSNTSGFKTAETWTIFGDPSLKIRTDDAIAMNVTHVPHITSGSGFFELSCDAAGAYAAITLNGEIICTATEAGGWISLPIGELDEGDLVTLAITAYNCIPYITQLEVIPAGPYADFTAVPLAPAVGENVIFTDASGGGDFSTWEWTFGEGAVPASATGQGPHNVVYNTPGWKTISLVVDGLYSREKVNYIHVKDWFTLTIDITGSGSVEVDGVPYTEPLTLVEGSNVSLQAFGDINTSFFVWSGDLTSSDNPVSFLIDGNKNITAGFAYTVSAIYDSGDIPTDSNYPGTYSSSACPGTLTVAIPTGATIISVDVGYQMTALNLGWMSEQRSQLRCISPGGVSETNIAFGSGTAAGTYSYERKGLAIANGVSGGGEILFELHAGRTWSSSGQTGCKTYNNRVDNNTWEIKVYYLPTVTLPLVETAAVDEISSTSAMVGGNVIDNGGGEITERGAYWSDEPSPEITGVKLIIGNGAGSFSATLDGLLPRTNYYVKAYAINSAGTAFGDEEVFTTLMHENLQLEDVIISTTEDTCYDASQLITLAGNGCIFWVEPGAVAELVAGHCIRFLEGTHVKHESYLHARIALNGDYCHNPESLPLAGKSEVLSAEPIAPIIPETLLFHVYPNPTNGVFTLEFTGSDLPETYTIKILNLMGKEILREVLNENHNHSFDLSDMPSGIYILHVFTGTESGVTKIIRR